jgi:hypothetical protein
VRFLGSADAEVLCVKGEWGIGKTYAWNHYLKRAVMTDAVKLEKYSYVSLFGLQNLSEFKIAIFENIRRIAGTETFFEKWSWQRVLSFVGKHPKLKSYAEMANPVIFSFVRNQIICIDDLERRGKDIRVIDVLGIANSLKEEQGFIGFFLSTILIRILG